MESASWYLKAAKQGNALGQFYLGCAYADGKGVPKDAMEAYKWCNLSAASGTEGAATRRSDLEAKMTPDQIAEAQKRTKELRALIDANINTGSK